MKKIPVRRCVATNTSYPKEDLFRVVNNKDMGVVLDITGKLNGRGAYIHKDFETIEKARKNKALDKTLGIEIPDEIYDRMIMFLKMK